MSEQAILAALSIDRVRAHIEHITEKIPSRLAGTENQRRMAEYSAQALRDSGIEAVVHHVPGLVSFPERADFKVVAPVELTIDANTLGHLLTGSAVSCSTSSPGRSRSFPGRIRSGRSRSPSFPTIPRATKSSASPRC